MTEKCVIEIVAKPLNEKSSPDIFMANPSLFNSEEDTINETDAYRHTWKSDSIGMNRILILPIEKKMELGTWVFGTLEANTNMEGPVLNARLPRWNADRFTLHLEVEGHPEYNSDYTFLLSGE